MYYLRVNKEQLLTIANALDSHSRILCGDMAEAIKTFHMTHLNDFDEDYVNEHMGAVSAELCRLPLHASYGMYSKDTPENAKLEYEIYKAIMHRLWKENKSKSFSVHSRIEEGLTKHPTVKIQKTFELLRKKLKRKVKIEK